MTKIQTEEQLNRVTRALHETYAAIEKMESPRALSRNDQLIASHWEHASNLAQAIGEHAASKLRA
jgi:hypothetical protein